MATHHLPRREYSEAAYEADEYCDWPVHIDQAAVLRAAEGYAPAYAAMPDAEFNAEGVRLGLLLSGECSAYLCDEVRRDQLGKRERAAFEACLDTLARSIALGACAPGGLRLWGVNVEYTA